MSEEHTSSEPGWLKKDAFTGAFFVLAGLVLLVWVIPAETIIGEEEELSQAFMPSVAAWLFVICGAVLVLDGPFRSWLNWNRQANAGTKEDENVDGKFAVSFLLGLSVLGAAILGIYLLGFLVGGGLAIFIFSLTFDRSRWRSGLAGAVIMPPVVYGLAWYGLRLILP